MLATEVLELNIGKEEELKFRPWAPFFLGLLREIGSMMSRFISFGRGFVKSSESFGPVGISLGALGILPLLFALSPMHFFILVCPPVMDVFLNFTWTLARSCSLSLYLKSLSIFSVLLVSILCISVAYPAS